MELMIDEVSGIEERRLGKREAIDDLISVEQLPPEEAELIHKTKRVKNDSLYVDTSPSTRPLNGRISIGDPSPSNVPPIVTELEEHKAKLESDHGEFPHLAWEAVQAALAKEQLTNAQINGHIATAKKHQKEIDLLLDLNADLTAYKPGFPMSEEMKNRLQELKDHDIDLWKGKDQTLTKEKVAELKSLSSAQVEKLRSNLQILFTTKIQVLIQAIGAILEAVKQIIQSNSRLNAKATQLPGH